MTEMGLIAATDDIVPVEPRYLETVGLMSVIGKINDIRDGWHQPNLRVSGILVTKFPPDFDGAAIFHQLYTLALTHFQAVYTNYFERPDLHKLHNRSGELWSPLVVLAAFFEEQGGVSGLLDAISGAAQWDEQMSEGKSLNEREEVVLQALELLTHSAADAVVWVKGSDLCEKIRGLLGMSGEEMGNTQWIGHILKRLQLIDPSRRKHHVSGKVYAMG